MWEGHGGGEGRTDFLVSSLNSWECEIQGEEKIKDSVWDKHNLTEELLCIATAIIARQM